MATQRQKPETKRKKPSPAPPTHNPTDVPMDWADMLPGTEETVVVSPPVASKEVVAQSKEEAEAWSLVETFDARLTEAERRIDRILARLGVE